MSVTIQTGNTVTVQSGNRVTISAPGPQGAAGADGAGGITALTGDVTASGTGSVAATIANDAVTYAKLQNVSAASRLIGRGSSGGAGNAQELTTDATLSIAGTVLSAVGSALTGLNGDAIAAGSVSELRYWNGQALSDAATFVTTGAGSAVINDTWHSEERSGYGTGEKASWFSSARDHVINWSSGTSLWYIGNTLGSNYYTSADDVEWPWQVTTWSAVDFGDDPAPTFSIPRLFKTPVANGGTGATTLSANGVLLGNGTGALQTVAPSTSGNVLTSNGTTWTSAAPSGGGSGTKTIGVYTPRDNQPPASAFATLDTRNSVACLDFDTATEESAIFVGVIPEAAVLTSGITVRITWAASTATSGDCRWGAAWMRCNTDIDSDSFDTATEATTTTSGTSGIPSVTSITCTTIDSLAVGEMYRLKIYRDTGDAADTMAGDAELLTVEVRTAN